MDAHQPNMIKIGLTENDPEHGLTPNRSLVNDKLWKSQNACFVSPDSRSG